MNVFAAVDLGASSGRVMTARISAESLEKVDFTSRYYATPARFAARKENELKDIRPEALEGKKIGVAGLDRWVPRRRLTQIRKRARERGAIALAVLDLIPPPFPFTPFVLAAGALEVRMSTFFVTLAACRILRFGAEAALAIVYGHRVLSMLDSDLFHETDKIEFKEGYTNRRINITMLYGNRGQG